MLQENKLTEKEFLFVTMLFLLTKGGKYAVAGSALAYWIGGTWSTWRHRKMLELESRGWVVCQRIPFRAGSKKNRWFYHLTDGAYEYLEKTVKESLQGNRYDLTKTLEF